MRRLAGLANSTKLACAACVLFACNSLDERGPKGSAVIIPTDVRASQQALQSPPAISGGTLAATADGRFAIAADPDRDRVSVVDLGVDGKADGVVVRQIALNPGDEPGRVVTEGAFAYVALRRSGEVALIDVANAALVQRVHVCAAPRGMALQPELGVLHVACNEGRLVTLTARSTTSPSLRVVRSVALESDLRDVLVQGEELLVSKFKAAELLRVDASGALVKRESIEGFQTSRFATSDNGTVELKTREMQPHVAWRTARGSDGSVFVLHQGAASDVVPIDEEALKPKPNGGSAYGGSGLDSADPCGAIVVPAVTRITPFGGKLTTPVSSGTLTVDLAVSNDNQMVAMVQAGAPDEQAPRPQIVVDTDDEVAVAISGRASPALFFDRSRVPPGIDVDAAGTSSVMVQPANSSAGGPTCNSGPRTMVVGQATAVTFVRNPGRRDGMLVYSRQPALLTYWREVNGTAFAPDMMVALGGENVSDTGHDIFHRDAGGGLACASCHAEGAEDGHVWNFNTVGLRRTQALHVGLEGTAPFHWNGEETDMDHLMEDVFVKRMGGVHQSGERLHSLTRYLFALQPPAAAIPDDELSVERGEALFMSADVGCASCHSGAKFTNNKSADVGTGGLLQVPSLRAIAYRAPFMHTGCAKTLRDRFDPACGGKEHGRTASLSEAQLGDLVAFLKTL